MSRNPSPRQVVMNALGLIVTMVLLSFCVVALNATTIHVPHDQPTIQAGIDVAVDGDTVLVADGTYTGDGNRDIDFLGKAIVVMSENGAENCIIDCEGDSVDYHRGFYFHSGEDLSSVVQGFTIKNGYAPGGGIYCYWKSSPTIRGNTISGNRASSNGGGIRCDSESSPVITGNTITGNVTNFRGGGIYCFFESSPIISDNTIAENVTFYGGGIYCTSSSPTITANRINGNVAYSNGGGICCYPGSPTITDNTITENIAELGGGIYCRLSSASITKNEISKNIAESGGGIWCYYYSPTIARNRITGNVSSYSGGGIYCSHSSPSIAGNTIAENTADNYGGGIYCYRSSPTILGSTIKGNTSGGGGGIRCSGDASPIITNTILRDDSPDEILVGIHSNPVVTYSNVQGGWPGEGNIDEDPLFVLPEKDDYRLLWESPCIDTGHPDSLDADGTRSDMGAHFFNQDDYLTLYMTPDTTTVAQSGQMGVTYTIINRWPQKERFTMLSCAILPDGRIVKILGPEEYSICATYTAQIHLTQDIPRCAYVGTYTYRAAIGVPPSTLYDWDSFKFKITERKLLTTHSRLSHQRRW